MLSWTDLIAAAKARWRLELAVFVLTIGLVALWTIMTPKGYVAQSSLLFDTRALDPVQDAQTQQETIAALLSTQADTIQSDAVAAEVSRSLHLDHVSAFLTQWRQATGGSIDINNWIGQQLLPHLEVSPGRISRVLAIQYTSPDPDFSAQIANGFAQSYLNTRLKLQTDPARTYAVWFANQTREVRGNLESAQDRLADFEKRTGIVDSETFNTEDNRLVALSAQLANAEAAAADSQSRAGADASGSPDVQSSGVVQALRSQIAQKTAELSQMSAELGPNHPQRIAAEAELEALRAKLAHEVGVSARSLTVASDSASSKQADLHRLVEAQRQRMLGLADKQNTLAVLQHDVDSARAAYDSVTQKLNTMRLQAEAPASNASQLDIATPPVLPSKPNLPLRALLGVVLGLVLAAVAGLGLEFWLPLVRTESGLAAAVRAPVLTVLNLSQSRVAGVRAGGQVE